VDEDAFLKAVEKDAFLKAKLDKKGLNAEFLQGKLDEIGFYGLTTDILRVTHIGGTPVLTREGAEEEFQRLNESND